MSRPIGQAIRDWAELGRVSNLPTIFSNALVGGAIGAAAPRRSLSEPSHLWPRLAAAAAAIAIFYVAGMILNDVADESIDRVERPKRPIPSGRVRRGAAIGALVWLFIGGLSLLGALGTPALAWGAVLVTTIVAYDLFHARHPASVILMGLCRGLAYAVAAAAIAGWPSDRTLLGACAATITTYVILLTVIARSESQETLDRRKWLAAALPIVAILPVAIALPMPVRLVPPIIAGLALLAWLASAARHVFAVPPRTRHAVMAWLAGICLVDAFLLAWLGRPWWAMAAAGCFAATTAGHRRILGS